MDIFLAEVSQGLDVVFDVAVAVFISDLDRVGDVDGLDAGDVHAGRGDFVLQGADAFAAPDLARCRVVQGRDDARDARDLADLLKRDRVEF